MRRDPERERIELLEAERRWLPAEVWNTPRHERIARHDLLAHAKLCRSIAARFATFSDPIVLLSEGVRSHHRLVRHARACTRTRTSHEILYRDLNDEPAAYGLETACRMRLVSAASLVDTDSEAREASVDLDRWLRSFRAKPGELTVVRVYLRDLMSEVQVRTYALPSWPKIGADLETIRGRRRRAPHRSAAGPDSDRYGDFVPLPLDDGETVHIPRLAEDLYK